MGKSVNIGTFRMFCGVACDLKFLDIVGIVSFWSYVSNH